jgi:hypothetical protein
MSEQTWVVWRPAVDYPRRDGVTVAARTPEAAACDAAEGRVDWWAGRAAAGGRMLDALHLVVAPARTPHDDQTGVVVRASLECVPIDSDGMPM